MAKESVITRNAIKIRTCRICLSTKCKNMVVLDVNSAWLCLYTYCSGLSLTANDEPRTICVDCADTLKKFGLFKEKCTKSDKLWKKAINDVTVCAEKLEIKMETDLETNNQNSNESVVILPNDCKTESDYEYLEENTNDNDLQYNSDESCTDNRNNEVKNDVNYTNESCKDYNSDNDIKNDIDNESCKDNVGDHEVLYNTEESYTKPKREYKCKRCRKTYGKKKWYTKHIKVCKRKKTGIIEDMQHNTPIKAREKFEKSLFCGFCNITSTDETALMKHLDEHWTNENLKCKVCEFVAGDVAQAMAHRYSHTPKQRYKCHICGVLKRLGSLEFHYRSVHLNKKGGFCFICNKEYDLYSYWYKHNLQHTTPGYTCDLCGNKYYFKHEIIQHIRHHNHLSDSKYVCDQCGKSFTKIYNLKSHRLYKHDKVERVKCPHCNVFYKNVLVLNRHLAAVKRGKTYECEKCHKKYYKPCDLKLHMISHTDDRPHFCDICKASFKYKAHLNQHLRMHANIKPFKCEQCVNSFSTTTQLKRHMSTHTGVRLHKCKFCDKSYNCIFGLKNHCAKQHNILKEEFSTLHLKKAN